MKTKRESNQRETKETTTTIKLHKHDAQPWLSLNVKKCFKIQSLISMLRFFRVNIVIENRGVCHPSLHTQRVFA